MSARFLHCLFWLLPLAAFACTVRANVGDLDRPTNDGGVESSEPDGNASRDASDERSEAARDASEPEATVIDGGCGVVLPQQGKFFDIQLETHAQPPFPKGGTLTPGVYELTAQRYYYSGDTGTMAVRETMRVRGSSSAGTLERLIEAKNASGTFEAYPLHGETSTFVIHGQTIFITPECPSEDLERSLTFGVTGDSLTLFDSSTFEERVYRRIE